MFYDRQIYCASLTSRNYTQIALKVDQGEIYKYVNATIGG